MSRLRRAIDGFYHFVEQPLFLWSRPVLLLLVLPLGFALLQPVWHIDMRAPQYPNGLSVAVYAYKLEGGRGGADLREINVLNHYIGMEKLDRAKLNELDWLPFGYGILALLLLRVAALGNVRTLLDLAVLLGYFTAFAGWRFVYKLHGLGHNLSPDAPVHVQPFMPAIWGTKQIGNFTTHAGPGLGAVLMGVFIAGVVGVAFLHLIVGRRRERRAEAATSSSHT